jgi:pentatricopeptide repeat protein
MICFAGMLREMEGSGQWDCEALGIKPDATTYATLMNMWADNPEQGGVERVKQLLNKMRKDEVAVDGVVYGTLIKTHLRARDPAQAEKVLKEMVHDGLQPKV